MKTLNEIQKIAVLGASGKMGRGIVWLLVQYFFTSHFNKGITFQIHTIDVSEEGLISMLDYVRAQAIRYAEKKPELLKQLYEKESLNLDQEQLAKQYAKDIVSHISISTALDAAANSSVIFEAVVEKLAVKVQIIREIEEKSNESPFYFTNTSSIPIKTIEEKANVKGRIIGFHFYNPPPVQKLLEIIKTENSTKEIEQLADEVAFGLGKHIVYAPDFTGFIGNGQFIREISYAIGLVERLVLVNGLPNAIYMVNQVTKRLLLRPMGIFEVVDYVGINVCQFIMDIMEREFKNEQFNNSLLKRLLKNGIYGGQDGFGKVKNGIFKYENGELVAVYNRTKYEAFDPLDLDHLAPNNWKDIRFRKDLDAVLSSHFDNLSNSGGLAAKAAVKYGKACNDIGKRLVDNELAFSEQDVNTVMMLGFHHLYGPINSFFHEDK